MKCRDVPLPDKDGRVDIQAIRDHIATDCECPYTKFLMHLADVTREQLDRERGTAFWPGKAKP